MPCKNVTELLRLTIDERENIVDYDLAKETCGAAVGDEPFLLGFFKDRPYTDILDLDTERFCKIYPVDKRLQFICLKHFIALSALLRVYTGREAGGVADFCTIADIKSDNGAVTIEAQIAVDLVTEKIKSCGYCNGCGQQNSNGQGRKHKRAAKKKSSK